MPAEGMKLTSFYATLCIGKWHVGDQPEFLPTAVALAGGTVPEQPEIDGRDISPPLLGKITSSPRKAHYYFSSYQLQAVRQGPWAAAPSRMTKPRNRAFRTLGNAIIADRNANGVP